MVRVSDLDASLHFYSTLLGLEEIRRKEVPAGRFTLVFLAAPGDEKAQVELTYNWGVEEYDLGKGFGHIAIGVDDIYATCDAIKAVGGNVTREPGPVKGGTTHIAFVKDPDGYMIELIQNRQASAGLEG